MFPSNPIVYPEYVADQVLTAHDLNESFKYLDEQGRLTRINLIGIGIVCGLQVQYNASTKEITITQGVGVTSEGYLVRVSTITYSKFIVYDQLKDLLYDRFVNTSPTISKKFDLWELKQASTDPTAKNLSDPSAPDLNNMVVMIFVELLQVGNKNCDPNSCDDKGKHYEVNFRPLLVSKANAQTLLGESSSTVTSADFTGLADIKLKRFDVPNTKPITSQDIFNAYKSILSNSFLTQVETTLTNAYAKFSPVIVAEHPTNPFSGLAAAFAFINGTITADQLKHIQYYYDLFSDFILAYEEFRKTGMHILSTCCPDYSLFPRHLLLGELVPDQGSTKLTYRHYFIYSPLFERKNLLAELKSLFKKLVLLKERFSIPAVNSGSPASIDDPNIRITPSKLGDKPLSQKAIPYYYNVAGGNPQLFSVWNYEKTSTGKSIQNLSYHATSYNGTDDFVKNPLLYDLEPYNFLRVEGIIGKPYVSVLRNVKKLITDYRLPVDVIALNTDNTKLFEGINSLSKISSVNLSGNIDGRNLLDMLCHFQDLEAMYEAMKNEMLCILCKELKYYYDLRLNFLPKGTTTNDTTTNQLSKVGLFNSCAKGYIVKRGTFGFAIEKVYEQIGDESSVTVQAIIDALDLDNLATGSGGDPTTNFSVVTSPFLGYIVMFFEIPIYIIRLANTLTANLSSFNAEEYCAIQKTLAEKANNFKVLFSMFTAADKQALRNELAGTADASSLTAGTDAAFGTTIGTTGMLAMLKSAGLTQNTTGKLLLFILLLEDFFDHLDALIYNCKCSAFKSLKTEYLKRLAYLTLLRQFGYFTKMHPGIQHKAGVPMGGTFIIVYHSRGRRISVGSSKARFVIRGTVVDDSQDPLPGATVNVQNTSRATVTNSQGQFQLTVNELPVTVVASFTGIAGREMEITSEDVITIVLGGDDVVTENVMDSITEGMVIADFYLPYRCCSDCPPIQYIVKDTPEPSPENRPPIVNAGPDQVITLPTNSVRLNGSATDFDGTVISFEWIRLSGPNQPNFATPASAQTDVTNLVQGVYEFELTATDNKGAKARDSMLVKVESTPPPPNQPPIANAGLDLNLSLVPGTPVTGFLDGSASSDPEGGTLTYLWSLQNGPVFPLIASPNLDKTAVTFNVAGAYDFKLTVTDPGGLSHFDMVSVKVSQSQVAKTCSDFPKIVSFFDGLPNFDPTNFGNFRELFRSYDREVLPLFRKFGPGGVAVTSLSIDDQVVFFSGLIIPSTDAAGNVINLNIAQSLEKWFTELQDLIMIRQGDSTGLVAQKNKLRRLMLIQYRILVQLAMYIVCIQKTDFNTGRIPLIAVFKLIRSHVREWSGNIQTFASQHVIVVKDIGDDVKKERDRVTANGEATIKPRYMSDLLDIITIIAAIP